MRELEPRRLKAVIMTAATVASGLTIVSWTQPWFAVALVDDELGGGTIDVAGDVAAGGLAGLGLAGLALVGALSIAGPVIRVVLGVLQALIGVTIALSATIAVGDPVAASAASITEATGIAGDDSVAELVQSATVGFWPYAAVVLGAASILLGVVIVITAGRWPGSSRKYRAVRFEAADDPLDAVAIPAEEGTTGRADAAAPADAVADWDALSDGSDPTSR